MDQPGRCRRTDGKRWRCSKDVIPNEKYCENHMHRGCQRSRKFMDNPRNASKVQPNLKLKLHPSPDLPSFPLNKTMKENGSENEKIEDSDSKRGRHGSTKIVFKQAPYASAKVNECANEKEKAGKIRLNEKLSSSLEDDSRSYGKVKVERVRGDINSNNIVAGLDFSPKSVLRDEGSTAEPWRCRRTDGKRWRCRKEVVAEGQKYCAKHMHRGAKKHVITPQDADCGNKPNPFALVKRANKLIVGFDSNLSA